MAIVKKQVVLDEETEAKLMALADQDERSQSGEVRYLIASEFERRMQLARVAPTRQTETGAA